MSSDHQHNDSSTPLLRLESLRVEGPGGVSLLHGVSLDVGPGEAVGLVGGSGSGKSTLALALLDLLPAGLRRSGGRIVHNGVDLDSLDSFQLRRLRGRQVGLVFQEPRAALNPVLTVGAQLVEPMRRHLGLDRAEASRRATAMLTRTGIVAAKARLRAHAHQLSGGMCQRVMLAQALACEPSLLVADEPTSSVDSTTQLQLLKIIDEYRRERSMGVLLITHDLSLVAGSCQRLVVLNQGEVVESGPVQDVLAGPQHPYTEALLDAARRLGGAALSKAGAR